MSVTPRPRDSPPLADEQDAVPDLLPHLRADPSPFLSCSPEHRPRANITRPPPPHLQALTPALPGFRSSSSPSPSSSSSSSSSSRSSPTSPPPARADLPASGGGSSAAPREPPGGRRRSVGEWFKGSLATASARAPRARDNKEQRAGARRDEKRRRDERRIERKHEEAREYAAHVERWQAETGGEAADVATNYVPPGGWCI
ncbi:hypothetical protein JCM21900_000280 [Sporobolomyces salmonicolor]